MTVQEVKQLFELIKEVDLMDKYVILEGLLLDAFDDHYSGDRDGFQPNLREEEEEKEFIALATRLLKPYSIDAIIIQDLFDDDGSNISVILFHEDRTPETRFTEQAHLSDPYSLGRPYDALILVCCRF